MHSPVRISYAPIGPRAGLLVAGNSKSMLMPLMDRAALLRLFITSFWLGSLQAVRIIAC